MKIASVLVALSLVVCVTVSAAPQQNRSKAGSTSKAKKVRKSKVVTTKSGLKYVDLVVGKGASPKLSDIVKVNYRGWFNDKREFDSSKKHGGPIEFQLVEMIDAWKEAIPTMKVGGKRRLYVPSKLGYGPQGHPAGIPPNTDLNFEIELLGFTSAGK